MRRYPDSDPCYAADDRRPGLVGARHDVSANPVLKLEVLRRWRASVGSSSRVIAQAAIGL